jgi:hypothetical protein
VAYFDASFPQLIDELDKELVPIQSFGLGITSVLLLE